MDILKPKCSIDADLPQYIYTIFELFNRDSKEIFLVGGSVRDLILNIPVSDWDFTTDALPDEIVTIADKAGIESFCENIFGTVTLKMKTDNEETHLVEITTYRSEQRYSDRRHPDRVTFSESISEDVMRRDFTINALFAGFKHVSHGTYVLDVYDLYDGLNDLSLGIIKTVGDAHVRFNEDPLRILRAVRFVAKTGFEIDNTTKNAMISCVTTLKHVSWERITEEIRKLLSSAYIEKALEISRETGVMAYILPEMLEGVGCDQSRNHIYDVWTHNIKASQAAARNNFPFHVRLAALLHDIGKPRTRERDKQNNIWTFYNHEIVGASMVYDILNKRFKFGNEINKKVTLLVRYHMFFSDTTEITLTPVRRLLANIGEELVWDLMNLRRSDRLGMGRPEAAPYRLRKFEAMIEEVTRDPISLKRLMVNGDTLINEFHMKPGPRMGDMLYALFANVLNEPKNNIKDILFELFKNYDILSDIDLKNLGKEGRDLTEGLNNNEIQKLHKKHKV